MNYPGAMYHSGVGMPPDYQLARQWYQRAAAGGNSVAMYNLGLLYFEALGVSQDDQLARQWFEKAAAAGENDAKEWLRAHPK
jgi:uncharacterized protein